MHVESREKMQKGKMIKWAYCKGMGLAIIVSALFLPCYMKPESTGNNIFYVSLNGVPVGTSAVEDMEDYVREARLRVAGERSSPVLFEAEVSVEGEEVFFGRVDSAEEIISNMEQVMRDSEKETLLRSYTVKINEFTVNLASSEDVLHLLNAVLDKYDTENRYDVSLIRDPSRELNVLTTRITDREEEQKKAEDRDFRREAGADASMNQAFAEIEPEKEMEFSDYELGVVSLAYGDTVEVVEAWLPSEALTPVADAVRQVTNEEEKSKIYEVVAGDTLSEIALDNDLPMEKLIAMNPAIEDENSTIRVGDEIIVTSPEPALTVLRQEQEYYEENYDADVIYIDNDSWYTTERVTRQEPSAGHRKVVAVVSYRNDAETGREIQKEEVTMEAVAKVVERGTKIPPSYIKPISGGRLSSGFGRRNAPTKGASSYHKGIDWATPIGTTVMASCDGVVTKAGWGSGYGYVVYIDHGDGRQTRYGHLSKVLVKAGQHVSQGQKIALSGNTGRSTGPHVHFEILIGGSQVNPLNHLS